MSVVVRIIAGRDESATPSSPSSSFPTSTSLSTATKILLFGIIPTLALGALLLLTILLVVIRRSRKEKTSASTSGNGGRDQSLTPTTPASRQQQRRRKDRQLSSNTTASPATTTTSTKESTHTPRSKRGGNILGIHAPVSSSSTPHTASPPPFTVSHPPPSFPVTVSATSTFASSRGTIDESTRQEASTKTGRDSPRSGTFRTFSIGKSAWQTRDAASRRYLRLDLNKAYDPPDDQRLWIGAPSAVASSAAMPSSRIGSPTPPLPTLKTTAGASSLSFRSLADKHPLPSPLPSSRLLPTPSLVPIHRLRLPKRPPTAIEPARSKGASQGAVKEAPMDTLNLPVTPQRLNMSSLARQHPPPPALASHATEATTEDNDGASVFSVLAQGASAASMHVRSAALFFPGPAWARSDGVKSPMWSPLPPPPQPSRMPLPSSSPSASSKSRLLTPTPVSTALKPPATSTTTPSPLRSPPAPSLDGLHVITDLCQLPRSPSERVSADEQSPAEPPSSLASLSLHPFAKMAGVAVQR